MSYGQQEDKAGEAQRVSEMVEMILEKNQFVCIFETEELLFPRNGVYHTHGENLVKEYCELWAPARHWACTNHFVVEVVEKIRRKCYVKAKYFDKDPNIINLHNGILDIKDFVTEGKVKFLNFDEIPSPSVGEIQDNDKLPWAENRYLSRIQIPVEYNPEAKCPKILKFLTEVLPDSRDRRVLLEFAAITLFRSPMFHRAMMLVGEGRNGKSTFVFVLQALLGNENVSNVSIHDIVNNRFMKAELSDKLGNFFPDINSKEISQLGILQSIIAGDRLKVERKGRDPYDSDWFVKLIFSCNKLPQISDPTIAWWERWSIIKFGESFIGRENRHLANKDGTGDLQTPEELSGFLNLLLQILREVLKRGRLTDSKTNDQKREEWGEMANHLMKFVKGQLVVDQSGCVKASEFYPSYVSWCGTKYIALGRKEFIEQVQQLVPIRPDTKRFGGRKSQSEKIWKGVRFKDDKSQTLDATGGTDGKGSVGFSATDSEDGEVAPGVWVARSQSNGYPRPRGYYPNRFLEDIASKAKADGWGEFAKTESKGDAGPLRARKSADAFPELHGLRSFEEPKARSVRPEPQQNPVASPPPPPAAPEPKVETPVERPEEKVEPTTQDSGKTALTEIPSSVPPVDPELCGKCKKEKAGKFDRPSLDYRITVAGQRISVCRNCWVKDQMAGRTK